VLPRVAWWEKIRGRVPKRWREARRRLRFTPEGRAFVGLTVGVGFAAINTGNNLMYLVLGMMLSLIIVSGVLSELGLQGLEVERSLPTGVHAGRPYLTGISLHNTKRRLASFSIQIEDVIDGHSIAKRCYFLKIPPTARQQTSYRSEFPRRGAYRYEGYHLSTRFPFGFFVKTRFASHAETLIVLPRILPVDLLPEETRARLGTWERPARGQGREFHGLRAWRDGDDARDIHWKRSAREGRVVLREYAADATRRIGVLLDDRRESAQATPEATLARLDARIDHAASLVTHFQARGCVVEVCTSGEHWIVEADGRGLAPLLRRLALLEAAAHDAPDPATRRPRDALAMAWLQARAEVEPARPPAQAA
jgi:uncharacterized protein (DUF58 family)